MSKLRSTSAVAAACLLAACQSEPPPPVTVTEFLDDPILLEATMVRCSQDRSRTKYEAECVNAREAANKLAAVEEEKRRIELEKQSERKRRALRRAQEAKAEARRRAQEAQRLREEAEYLGIYDVVAAEEGVNTAPPGAQPADPAADPTLEGNQPGVSVVPPTPEQPAAENTDIDAVREELRRRNDSTG